MFNILQSFSSCTLFILAHLCIFYRDIFFLLDIFTPAHKILVIFVFLNIRSSYDTFGALSPFVD